jgi:tetratricopeptide (TPR) repeat protein
VAGASTLGHLQERGLVDRTLAGKVVVHGIIRENVRENLSEARRRAMHDRAAKLLLRKPTPENRLECLYHLLQAGRMEIAARLLDEKGAELVDSISIHELVSVVKDVDLEQLEARHACAFAEVLGDGLQVAGNSTPALMQYQYTLRKARLAGNSRRTPRILRKMASIERIRENHRRAERWLREAAESLGQNPDPAESCEVLRELALVEQGRGDFPSAIAHLNEAIDLATELSDSRLVARGLLALGSAEEQLGNNERALGYKLEGLRIAERSGNLTETARGLVFLGNAQAGVGRHSESLRPYERALSIARLLGNLRLTSYALMGKCSALLDLGRYAEAGPLLAEANSLFQLLDEEQNLALLRVYEGQREMGLGHWARARVLWDDGLARLEKLGDQYDLARSLKEIGSFHLERGYVKEGYRYLERARPLAHNLGNVRLTQEVESLLRDSDVGERADLAGQPPALG